ncbi:MAG TPA: hypothetical protein VF556_02465 [Pyrinomonadaceae bacterium]|jgi:hypothetical protein
MFNCSEEILGYHNDKSSLPQSERDAMRNRRNSNRDRVYRGLDRNEKPSPSEFASQGSYSMKTMVQHPENDYDIDDGVYFLGENLKDSYGIEMSSLTARQMIRDAVDDGSFNTPPVVCENCVRVQYQAGYHVDIPVYRQIFTQNADGYEEFHFELASTNWVRSDARDVTAWFDGQNQNQSPDTTNGRQMRRMCRLIKKFAISRPEWKGQIGSGFMITKLVTECYLPNANREDVALYDTMKAIRDRLNDDLIVHHPVTPNSTLTKGNYDPKAIYLRDRLTEALADLDVLFQPECTDEEAMKAWDKVFQTNYFSSQLEDKKEREKRQATANTTLVNDWGKSVEPEHPVEKRGGGRYA